MNNPVPKDVRPLVVNYETIGIHARRLNFDRTELVPENPDYQESMRDPEEKAWTEYFVRQHRYDVSIVRHWLCTMPIPEMLKICDEHKIGWMVINLIAQGVPQL